MVDPAFERSRSRAASPGRIRDLAVELFQRALDAPRRAESLFAKQARQARSLQSRDRRYLFEGLYQMIRYEARLREHLNTTDLLALWLGWLVHDGLDPALARTSFEDAKPGHTVPEFEAAQALMTRTSLPVYAGVHPSIADRLHAHYGEEVWDWVDASNRRAPVSLRANLKKTHTAALVDALNSEGIETRPGRWCPESLHVIGRHNLMGSRCFRDGLFEVQDEGSVLLSKLIPDRGEGLDLCAGAGGKTLARAAETRGSILATDIRSGALNELQKRATRAGVQVKTRLLPPDGTWPADLEERRFDWILVDTPCSGLGVLRRHPAHRWIVDPETLSDLIHTQDSLLDRAAAQISPGGMLIYGTCSSLPIENEARITAFLERHPDWEVRPAPVPEPCRSGPYLHCEPHIHDTDGFFGATLHRSRG